MKQYFETIKTLVESLIHESAKQLPVGNIKQPANLAMAIPNQFVRDLIDYWRNNEHKSGKNDKNDKENRLKRMRAAAEWLYQSDNKKYAQRKSELCKYPMSRGQGVQLFILLIYRYYFGHLKNMLFHDDPARRTGYFKGQLKTANISNIRKSDLEFQAIVLALQEVGHQAFESRFPLRQSQVIETSIEDEHIEREAPKSVEETAESAMRPSLAIHTTVVSH